jgi:polyhydroxybutyrate depolymerase
MRRAAFLGLFAVMVLAAGPGPESEAVEQTIHVDGRDRTYRVFAPGKTDKPMPVVMVFHGGGGSARQMERYSQFNPLAAKEGFLAVYPQSVGGNWNDGRGVSFIKAQREEVDDVKFVRAIVDEVGKDYTTDRSRIFSTGISNGAIFSHYLVTKASDLIAAIAPVVGGMTPGMSADFHPEHPVSILIIQGDKDPLIPYAGGPIGFPGTEPRGKVSPTLETLAHFIKRNGNPGEPTVTTLDEKPDDGTSVEICKYPDGPGGVKTELYLVRNGGHAWPGRPLYLPKSMIGLASEEFAATEVIWSFFKSCPPRKGK